MNLLIISTIMQYMNFNYQTHQSHTHQSEVINMQPSNLNKPPDQQTVTVTNCATMKK